MSVQGSHQLADVAIDRAVDQSVLSARIEGMQTPVGDEQALRDYAHGRIDHADYLRRCGLDHLISG